MLEVREDQRTVRIKRPVPALHATSQAETVLCHQETLDSSKSRKSSENIQKDGRCPALAQRLNPSPRATFENVIFGLRIDNDEAGAKLQDLRKTENACLPVEPDELRSPSDQPEWGMDLDSSNDQERRSQLIRPRSACKSDLQSSP
jgi:hypothetical protein